MKMYLIGMLVGDGSLEKRKNRAYAVWIDQHTRNLPILQRIERILKEQGLKTYFYDIPNSKKIFEIFKKAKQNPSQFFKGLGDEEKLQFISGFLDAEGTVTDRIVIYNSNKMLLEEIQEFLKSKGISSHIYTFGKVFGLQIYRRSEIKKLMKLLNSVKLLSSSRLKNIGGRQVETLSTAPEACPVPVCEAGFQPG